MRKFLHRVFDPLWLVFGVVTAWILTAVNHLSTAWFFGLVGIWFGSHVAYCTFRAIHSATAPPKGDE